MRGDLSHLCLGHCHLVRGRDHQLGPCVHRQAEGGGLGDALALGLSSTFSSMRLPTAMGTGHRQTDGHVQVSGAEDSSWRNAVYACSGVITFSRANSGRKASGANQARWQINYYNEVVVYCVYLCATQYGTFR